MLAVALVVGWALFLGHQRPERVAHRAILTQDVGTIHFGEVGAETLMDDTGMVVAF